MRKSNGGSNSGNCDNWCRAGYYESNDCTQSEKMFQVRKLGFYIYLSIVFYDKNLCLCMNNLFLEANNFLNLFFELSCCKICQKLC